MLQERTKSHTEIQYILISTKPNYSSPLLPSKVFENDVIEFIKFCPKDFSQLADGMNYYEICFRHALNNPYRFNVLFDIDFIDFYSKYYTDNQITLFFIDGHSKLFCAIVDYLKTLNKHLSYFFIINNSAETALNNLINSPEDFVGSLIENQKEILKTFGKFNEIIEPSIFTEFKRFINYLHFIPSRNNFFTLNSLLGNFVTKRPEPDSEKERIKLLKKESQSAYNSPNSFNRKKTLIDQIKKIDYFIQAAYIEKLFLPVVNSEPLLAPLIIIAPFNNPGFRELLSLPNTDEINNILSIMEVEQTENYISPGLGKSKIQVLQASKYMKEISKYLDDVSFLHGSYCFSPIIRLPIKGKSVYRELSFFRTSAFSRMDRLENRKNLKKTIQKFSAAYKKISISESLENLIVKRNGQIILLTDLPLEWLEFNNVPFCFTHDICRIPIVPYSGIMSSFVLNNNIEYIVSRNIIQKTLVILGSDDEPFNTWGKTCFKLSQLLGFIVKKCTSIKEISDAVLTYKPELLIFDCHGGYDASINSTVLEIGKERLTPDLIVSNKIVAPLVFISACGTAPTYGYTNIIANAFFEIGALSVTSTYLPIAIDSGSILYLRLLNNLNIASNDAIHKNWLEFISHINRSSFIMEKYNIAFANVDNPTKKILKRENVSTLNDLLDFNKRREVFNSIDNRISKYANIIIKQTANIIPEYLFYSNLGRSDLIKFECWLDEFSKVNAVSIESHE